MKMPADDFEAASIEETAANWFVRRRDGLSPEAEQTYQAWVGADPRHAAAMAEFQATWNTVSFPAAAHRGREAARILDRKTASRSSRPYIFAVAGLAAAAVLAFVILPPSSLSKAPPSVAAVAVRPNIETLPDGSTVELNANAEIAVNFTPERRSVQLVRGEAFFSVAKNAARPFVVSAQGVEVRAVGTAFVVRCDTEKVGVLVTEGRVAVEQEVPRAASESGTSESPPAVQPIYLDVGRQVVLTADRSNETPPAVQPLSAQEVGAALAWRSKRVEFSRMPLSDVAALFNSQNRVQPSIADRMTATIPISGIFWADDPEGLVRLLASGLGVHFERSADTFVLSTR